MSRPLATISTTPIYSPMPVRPHEPASILTRTMLADLVGAPQALAKLQ